MKKIKERVRKNLYDTDIDEKITPPEIKYTVYLKDLWKSSPPIYKILRYSEDLEEARDKLYTYLEKKERRLFDLDNNLHVMEKSTIRESIRVLRSIIGPINEFHSEFSALEVLWKLANGQTSPLKEKLSYGFLLEFIHLFRGIMGEAHIYQEKAVKKGIPDFLKLKGRHAARQRMVLLDKLGKQVYENFDKYASGLDDEVIQRRIENQRRILTYFKGTESDWNDYKWHLTHVIRTPKPLEQLIELSEEQRETVERAIQNRIAFGITPYYLSLMDPELSLGEDHAVRAQVIPPKDYVDSILDHHMDRELVLDFMGEQDTSPIDLITRRYPLISILKPFSTCAQICIYCQRNWEIECVLEPRAMASRKKVDEALAWLDEHKVVGDVLLTGGDPLVMKDEQLQRILEILSRKKQVYRIRIGSRTPVVLPMRITDKLVNMLAGFQNPPKLEIAIVTHFEHSYEITPDALNAVQKLRSKGISVYNQQVYTIENSRRFELAKLRRDLKSIGVDPYYTFNMKGKEETASYMVPIARILQERKEETRLLPGLDRTDEPIFNLPKLGKNYLRSALDRRLVMILADGARVYEFHPWEKNIAAMPPYNYIDVPIYDYLAELKKRGEQVDDYRTIWYYY
ncbi:MAG: KamA family radical SAM protein [bacterium]|nr:MAG: KamA family radical SAM protein [bacterium]